ncbi:MAG TPA: hypothetical protein DE038_05715, partial [Nitrospina sp.]|nr:hypothetical protein [Nitrospina sp.]
ICLKLKPPCSSVFISQIALSGFLNAPTKTSNSIPSDSPLDIDKKLEIPFNHNFSMSSLASTIELTSPTCKIKG